MSFKVKMKRVSYSLLRQVYKNRRDFSRCTSTNAETSKTHFGFQEVTPEEKHEKVNDVFSNVAAKYDLMNDAMSGGIHRCWKDRFISKLDPIPGTKLLDVAGGTGDIAFRFLDAVMRKEGPSPRSSVTVCDFTKNMLTVGEKRAQERGYPQPNLIQWVHGDAQNLPFEDNTFDAYTIAFGIRNVVNVQKALDESYRVLKPGGIFMCMEFSKVGNPLLESVYDWYSFNIIPVLGQVLAADWESYQYLVESIRQFPDQEDFASMIKSSGYTLVSYENLTFGVTAIHTAFKK